ncbi:MAG TPA: isoprenylcysteine carboxylmethyltransferase family protein [Myxococcaceae bacterium]|nr:isoprenylcysteine carboxylmethyltransferase family protein [Myxococcaceae bacterium]
MKRLAFLLYGIVAYAAFIGTTLYAVGFVAGVVVPRSVDAGGPVAPLTTALGVNVALLTLFGVQHSVMARKGFKQAWTRVVPPAIERSTYVLLSSACLALLFLLWHPIPRMVWSVGSTAGRVALASLATLGWLVALFSTFLINHFELFGLRQVFLAARRTEPRPPRFTTPLLYKLVRHPLYLGFILAFWAAPTMTMGHLVFALGMLGYILVGIQLEERDLVREFGGRYLVYREQVRALVPIPGAVPGEGEAPLQTASGAVSYRAPGSRTG